MSGCQLVINLVFTTVIGIMIKAGMDRAMIPIAKFSEARGLEPWPKYSDLS
jgi:hypothetical protein